MQRRAFIRSGAIGLFGLTAGQIPPFIARAFGLSGSPEAAASGKILICVFQRGAMDGLMAVSPYADPFLKSGRPSLYMEPSLRPGADSLIDLDGRFGLHPALAPLESFYRSGQLAILHGVGLTQVTRSHFDAQDFMETGTPFDKGTDSGWLNRAAGLISPKPGSLGVMGLTSSTPRSLYGPHPVVSVTSLADLSLRGSRTFSGLDVVNGGFEGLYDQTAGDILHQAGKETFEAMERLKQLQRKSYQPAEGVTYPAGRLGQSLKQLAQLIKMKAGLRIGFAESGGWDTHYQQGTVSGAFARPARDLADSLTAFWQDLGPEWQSDVLVMTMTEFGRTVKQNGTGGTDHGRGSCYFVLGHQVQGGRVYGNVPVLSPDRLEEGRDLPVSTDFRSLFWEVSQKHLGIRQRNVLFPGFTGDMTMMLKT